MTCILSMRVSVSLPDQIRTVLVVMWAESPLPELLTDRLEIRVAFDVAVVCKSWRDAARVVHGPTRMLTLTAFTLGGKGSQPGMFRHPSGMAICSNGDLVITEAGSGRLQIISAQGVPLHVIEYLSKPCLRENAKNLKKYKRVFMYPTSVAADANHLYVCHIHDLCDPENAIVKIRIDDHSVVQTLVSSHPKVNEFGQFLSAWDGTPCTEENGLAEEEEGIMYTEWFGYPADCVIVGDRLYVCDMGGEFGTASVHALDCNTLDGVLSTFGEEILIKPEVITHHDGQLFVCDPCRYDNLQPGILVFSTDGQLLREMYSPMLCPGASRADELLRRLPISGAPMGLAIARGRLIVSTTRSRNSFGSHEMKVHVVSPESGEKLQTIDLATRAPLSPSPAGHIGGGEPEGFLGHLAVDASRIYVGDYATHRYHVLSFI